MFHLSSLVSRFVAKHSCSVSTFHPESELAGRSFHVGNGNVLVYTLPSVQLLLDLDDTRRIIGTVPADADDEFIRALARSYFAGVEQCWFEWWTTP